MTYKQVKSTNAITLSLIKKQLGKIETPEKTLKEQMELLISICENDSINGEKISKQLDALIGCAKQNLEDKNRYELLADLAAGDLQELEDIKVGEKALSAELLETFSAINIICDLYGLKPFFQNANADVIWTKVSNFFNEEK